MPASLSSNRYLLLLVFSQFAGTSLWFAGNAIADKISATAAGASLTSYVQAGFISGTFIFSLLTVADRFSAKSVFFYSSLCAALANLCIIPFRELALALPILRFLTGFFLAGIYPVGMKIAADVFPNRLGKVLGLLVGALVAGTSFPHLVRSQFGGLRWQTVVLATSTLAAFGGTLVILFFPRKKRQRLSTPDYSATFRVFRNKKFRAAAFGYFGHMWELYAFWAILPLLFAAYFSVHRISANVYWWSFLVIGAGSTGCVAGGFASQIWGSKKVAFVALLFSGLCCVAAPLMFRLPPLAFFAFVLFWGTTVTADSPQFSALVAGAAEEKSKGTALTVVTCIGFAVTIVSIELLRERFAPGKETALWLLAPGPVLGLLALNSVK